MLTTAFEQHIDLARRELKAAEDALTEEIRSYPSPISGCDAQ